MRPGCRFSGGLRRSGGWSGHRHWRRARLLAHLALGLVASGRIERQREGLGLSFVPMPTVLSFVLAHNLGLMAQKMLG
jgi:hypothetical protein